jgi:hypothetical protein
MEIPENISSEGGAPVLRLEVPVDDVRRKRLSVQKGNDSAFRLLSHRSFHLRAHAQTPKALVDRVFYHWRIHDEH